MREPVRKSDGGRRREERRERRLDRPNALEPFLHRMVVGATALERPEEATEGRRLD